MSNYNVETELYNFKNRTINGTWLIGTILGTASYLIKYFPYNDILSTLFLSDTLTIATIIFFYTIRHKVSLAIRAYLLIGIMLVVIVVDLWSWGIHSIDKTLLVLMPYFAMFFFSMRKAMVLYALCMFGYLAIGGLHLFQFIPLQNHQERLLQPEIWIQSTFIISLVAFVLLAFNREYNRIVNGLIDHLKLRNQELEETNKKLEEEKAFTDNVINLIPGTFSLMKFKDDKPILLRSSKNTADIFEVSEEKLTVSSLLEKVKDEHMDKALDAFNSLYKNEPTQIQVQLKTQKQRWLLIQAHPFEHKGEKYFVSSGVDITKNKEMNNLLEKEKLFSDKLLDTVPGTFYLYELKNGDYELIQWNENFENIVDIPAKKLKGMSPFDFFPTEYHNIIASAFDGTMSETHISIEAPLKTSSGIGDFWFFENKSFVNGGKQYLLGFGIDISERKIMERELEHRNLNLRDMLGDLQSRNKQLAEYAFINAHLLRAPLARVLGLADVVSKQVKTAEDKKLIESFKSSSEELDMIVSKINEVLDHRTDLNRDEIINSLKNLGPN